MTKTMLGEKLGMTRDGVYDLMKRKNVKEKMVQKICVVLDVKREAFLLNENALPERSVLMEKKIEHLETLNDANKKIIKLLEEKNALLEHVLHKKQKMIVYKSKN